MDRPDNAPPDMPGAFVRAAALVPPLVLAKAVHWDWPGTEWGDWPVYARDVTVSAHADIAFILAFGLVVGGLLRLARPWPRAHRRLAAACTALGAFLALYASASVHIFDYLRSPLTYPLLYLAGDMRAMRSSIGTFVTPTAVAWLFVAAAGYVLSVRLFARLRLPGRYTAPVMRAAAILAAVVWVQWGYKIADGRWSDRPDLLIVQSPHWEFLSSLAEINGSVVPALDESFPPEYRADFEPDTTRLQPAAWPAARPRPRNLLLVVLETTGTYYLSLHGSSYPTTPHLAAEAAHALVFDRFYAHVGLSANSLAAISLSIYPYMTWREYTQDYPDFPGVTLANLLSARGYRTAFLTSSFLDYVGVDRFLQSRGFDQMLDWNTLKTDDPMVSSWGGSEAMLVDRTLEWIDRDRERPFYAMLWTQQSHHPYDLAPGQTEIDFFAGRPLPPDDYDLGRHLNTLLEVDRQVGRLLDGLRQRGLERDTLVVITGDHGEGFGDPHRTWGHGFRLWEECVQVPLMLWSPTLFPQGTRSDILGGHVDINPTVAEILDLPVPADWQGRSLFAPHRPPRAYFYAANDDYLLGVREDDWKYIYNATRGRDSLYDLANDPREQTDVAAAHPERCRTLRRRLAAWKQVAAERLARARGDEHAPADPTRRAAATP